MNRWLTACPHIPGMVKWRLPSLARNKTSALYILRTDVFAAHKIQLSGLRLGKGVIRYPRPDQIDMHVVRSMLHGTAASDGPVC